MLCITTMRRTSADSESDEGATSLMLRETQSPRTACTAAPLPQQREAVVGSMGVC
jgi:hypothetical protein